MNHLPPSIGYPIIGVFPLNPETLQNSWTAIVRLENNQVITIWYTAWPSTKHVVKEVLSISSDYPRFKLP
jgi:hypothetical protein